MIPKYRSFWEEWVKKMAEFDDKLNAILSNPQMMQQIMNLAGSFQQNQNNAPPPPQQAVQSGMPFDPSAMQGMLDLLRHTQPDRRQQDLLSAMGAYIPGDKLNRLNRAMQASRIAKYAVAALNRQGGK